MANVLAVLFVCLVVGFALWGTLRGRTLSCQDCNGDCAGCGAGCNGSCSSGKKLKLSRKQLAQIKAAKAAADAKKEVSS